MAVKNLKIACAGLGRMGKRHALNYLNHTPRAQLVAIFTPDPREIEWAQEILEPVGVKLFTDYDEMLKLPGLEAVAIATVTAVHAEQAIKAIDANLHVFSEKPLSTSVGVSQSVVDAAKAKPHLKVLCGFSRRFDKSYRDAYMRVNTIGRPAVFRSQTCDKLDPSGFFVQYAEFSGGIFVDCSIHDIDLALWFLGDDCAVKSVTAAGITAVEPDLRKYKDVDNGIGIVEFWNDKIAYFYCSRMMAAGQHDMTEIIGPKGKLVINGTPIASLVEMHEANGVRRELPANYYERFEYAFVTMANEFTAACLDDTRLPFELSGAVKALAIGVALQESVNTGMKILFSETGRRIE
ncbi:Fc.00g106010.m01.CDS01 [Cosmosporella sp. VM-42]